MGLFLLLMIIIAIAVVGMTIYNVSGGGRRTVVYQRRRTPVDTVVEDDVEVVSRPRRVVRRYD